MAAAAEGSAGAYRKPIESLSRAYRETIEILLRAGPPGGGRVLGGSARHVAKKSLRQMPFTLTPQKAPMMLVQCLKQALL